jgi:hypothetical protein
MQSINLVKLLGRKFENSFSFLPDWKEVSLINFKSNHFFSSFHLTSFYKLVSKEFEDAKT